MSGIETRDIILSRQRTKKALIRQRGKGRFCHDVAQIFLTKMHMLLYFCLTILAWSMQILTGMLCQVDFIQPLSSMSML